ncbi:nucleoside recognition protein [Halomicrobium katesii]|uniref:nucleoside recognition protein n=1 Tax=Halomicrobium katesii TaxID=437163 RepID=UPI000475D734|nr:nucleoside recognition protein [Halomicrobium katesii]
MQSHVALQSVGPVVDLLWGTVLPRVGTIAVTLALGVFLADLAVAFGIVEYIATLSKYLTEPANLPREVGTAILATTASPTAGYGMLAEFRESGVLDDRATLVAVTINTFFGFAQHIFTFYAPVLIPILGLRVGLLYVGARAAISLAITLVGILAGALLLSNRNVDRSRMPEVADPTEEHGTAREKLRDAAASTAEKLRDILPRLLVIYAIVAVLVAWREIPALVTLVAVLSESGAAGVVPSLSESVGAFTSAVGLPSAAVGVVAVYTIDTTNGSIVLAPFVENGTFTPRQAVATMLVGGIVSFAVSTFKRSIPFQYGIWGADFGSKVIAVNTTLKVLFIALAVVLLLVP